MNLKRFLLTINCLIIALFSFSQDISNSSFENWSLQTFYEEPNQYSTTNAFSYVLANTPNVTKTTDAFTGDYAIKLESINTEEDPLTGAAFIGALGDEIILGGLPFAERPDSVKGYAKYNVMENDTAYASVLFKKFGLPLGYCIIPFTGIQNEYTEFSAPVEWNYDVFSPDTLAIALLSSSFTLEPVEGSHITFDNLQFVGANTPFPNGDFEDWNQYEQEESSDWFTSNIFNLPLGTTSVNKSNDSYDGNHAIQIENIINFWGDTMGFITNGSFGENGPKGGMPVNGIPDKLSGYYKYDPVGNDSALAAITLYHYNESTGMPDELESVLVKLIAAEAYQYFELQVEYNSLPLPDTVNIAFASGNIGSEDAEMGLGSTLLLDNLNITYKTLTQTDEIIIPKSLSTYPNPVKNKFTIDISELSSRVIEVRVLNSQGIEVLKEYNHNLTNYIIEINVENLSPGVYFYHLQSGKKIFSGKLMKY